MLKILRPGSFSRFIRPLLRYTSSGDCSPAEVPTNTEFTILSNGIRVATEMSCSPLSCISLFVEAGSRYERVCNNGITHLIEHMAFKGFKSMSKCQLLEMLYCMGAKLSAQTTRELQIFSARCLPQDTLTIVDILTRIITEPTFFECDLEEERNNIRLELMDAENDPKQVMFDYLHQTAFQGTPLAQRVIGSQKNLASFDGEYCHFYLRDHYQPYKLALVGVGPMNHADVVNCVNSRLGCMDADAFGQSDEGPCRYTGSQIRFRDDSLPFAHVAIAFEAPAYYTWEYWHFLTAAHIIGSWDRSQGGGMNNASPLAQAAASGLCERYEAFYIAYRDVGLWGVYFVAKKMDLEDMLYNIQSYIMYLCTMVHNSDVQRGVCNAKLTMARSVQGNISSCYDLGKQTMYRCGRQSLADAFNSLDSVEANVLKELCDRYIYDRCPVVAAVGPIEQLPDYTRIRAGTYWLRL